MLSAGSRFASLLGRRLVARDRSARSRSDARKPSSWQLLKRDLLDTGVSHYDAALLWATLILLMTGVVMVYSTSISLPEQRGMTHAGPTYFLVRHLSSVAVAIFAAVIAFATPVRHWQKAALPLFAVTLLMLALVFVPVIGKKAGGAYRWLVSPIGTIQPTEFMKLAVILYVADYAARKQALMHRFVKGFLPIAVAIGLTGALIMAEPDLGALIVISCTAIGVLFIGGMSTRLFFGMGAMMIGIFSLFVLLVPFRRVRFFSFLEPFAKEYASGSSYQLTHSLMAIAKGEWIGSGLGAGLAKLKYLPEPHTDFMFATVGEELGVVGMIAIVFLFFWIVRRCFEIGRQAISFDLLFNGLVAQGVGLWIGIQSFINLGVNLGLLPTKGLTLPLMSWGGSAILMTCVSLAIVLRIDAENRRLMRGTVL
ncbi:MAG: putative lipid II flippase FtsW [Lautropia sp.]